MVRRFGSLPRLLVFGCLSASGCLLTTDLTGLAGADARPIGSPEGGGLDGASADGTADATSGDSTVPGCAALFCASFDRSTDLSRDWTKPEVTGGGSIALEKTIVKSPPHAFVATMAPGSDYDSALLTTYFNFNTKPTEFHLAMSVYFDQLDLSTNSVSLGVVGVAQGNGFSRVRLNVIPGRASIIEEYVDSQGKQQENTSTGDYAWPLHRWIRVQIDVSATTASLTIDGTTYATLAKAGDWNKQQTFLKLGVYYSKGQAGQRIVFDDVVLDAR